MKTVFSSNSDCIHAFAQRWQDNGRSAGGNVFFEGNKLYSYGRHFVLAEFIGGNTVLINDTRYSSSTAKHQSLVRSALSHYERIYESSHNPANVLSTLKGLQRKTERARKPEKYIGEALALIAAHKYAQTVKPTLITSEQAEQIASLEQFFQHQYS
jgi:hypothetical protein